MTLLHISWNSKSRYDPGKSCQIAFCRFGSTVAMCLIVPVREATSNTVRFNLETVESIGRDRSVALILIVVLLPHMLDVQRG